MPLLGGRGKRHPQAESLCTQGMAMPCVWSFYIFSGGGSLNQGWIGGLEAEGSEQLRLLRHFLAQ